MGRTATRELEAADFLNKEHDGAVDFAQAAAVNLVAGGQIEPITEREWKDQAEAVAFMQEPLTIHIHTSSDKNAPPAAMAGVNGRTVWFRRGTTYKNVPRCFVESLLRSQSTTYRTQQVRDPNADEQMQTMRTTSMDYPFSVVHDPNPKGKRWLERVMREG
jgi:uncharacterized protein (DUF2342 family)